MAKTPSMTRQDFQFIAEVLASCQAEANRQAKASLSDQNIAYAEAADDFMELVALTFAHRLAETNPAFDKDRFLVAAGRVLP